VPRRLSTTDLERFRFCDFLRFSSLSNRIFHHVIRFIFPLLPSDRSSLLNLVGSESWIVLCEIGRISRFFLCLVDRLRSKSIRFVPLVRSERVWFINRFGGFEGS